MPAPLRCPPSPPPSLNITSSVWAAAWCDVHALLAVTDPSGSAHRMDRPVRLPSAAQCASPQEHHTGGGAGERAEL